VFVYNAVWRLSFPAVVSLCPLCAQATPPGGAGVRTIFLNEGCKKTKPKTSNITKGRQNKENHASHRGHGEHREKAFMICFKEAPGRSAAQAKRARRKRAHSCSPTCLPAFRPLGLELCLKEIFLPFRQNNPPPRLCGSSDPRRGSGREESLYHFF
jgi:hypothetical protein